MPDIFISYRRQDAGASARLLRDRLRGEFGENQVFFDVTNIARGGFCAAHRHEVAACDALADILNQVVNHVNSVWQSLNGKNHQAAERSLENARNAFARSNAAFECLGTKKNRAAFHDAYDAYKVAKEMREVQSSLLAVSSTSIDLHRSDNIDGYNR